MTLVHEGLEGIVVARTALSDVLGDEGRLCLRGHAIEDIAGAISFEQGWHLLSRGALPTAREADFVRAELGRARVRAYDTLSAGRAATLEDGMESLRASVAALPSVELGDPCSLIGAVAVATAMFARRRLGLSPQAPDPDAPHAQDFLRLALGQLPKEAHTRALDAYLVTVMDHGLNASTFAARVVASTGADAVSAVVAAIGALKGPLHGGAPGPVLDMLDAIGSPDRAEAWLEGELAAGRRIMGMGHRVYRVRDPRAAVLERATRALDADHGTNRLALARAVESAAKRLLEKKHPARALAANVEFYTAVLLDAIGLPRWLFSPVFAVGRVAGWCAHIAEQGERGRLIRPSSLYDGPGSEGATFAACSTATLANG